MEEDPQIEIDEDNDEGSDPEDKFNLQEWHRQPNQKRLRNRQADNYSTFQNLMLQSKKNSLSNVGVNIAMHVAGGVGDQQMAGKGYKYNSNIARIRKQLMSSGR